MLFHISIFRLNFARFHKSTALYVLTLMLHRIYRSLSSLGFLVVVIATALILSPDWRSVSEWHLLGWLQDRQMELAAVDADSDTINHTTLPAATLSPEQLPKSQANLAQWLSKKYRVAPEPMSAIVVQAFETGQYLQLEPTLILAVMAIESGFNPFAQSAVGARGTKRTPAKAQMYAYELWSDPLKAFDPINNLRIGAKVLLDCITQAGSIEGGLKRYVIGSSTGNDSGYTDKVLLEQQRLKAIFLGQTESRIALASHN